MQLIAAGRAFVLYGRGFTPSPHLWIVLTDPDPKTNHVVATMLVTSRAHTDKTTALQPGDHAFIQHESNMDYGGTQLLLAGKIEAAMREGRCELQPDITPLLLQRIQAGLLTSPRTVHFIRNYCSPLFVGLPQK